MNNEPVSCGDMILSVFSNIDADKTKKSNELFGVWKTVVAKVGMNGDRLAEYTHPVDLKNGILLVESDHPGWTQLLQLNEKFIITGLNRAVPDLKITSLAYRLKGSEASLCGIDYKTSLQQEQEKMRKKLDADEKTFESFSKREENTQETPPELQNLFKSLKNSMLTNSKK